MHPSVRKSPGPVPAAVILLAILLAGLGLRLYRFNYQSVWYDEAFSLNVSHLPFHEMTATLIEDFVHPPLHYYLLHEVFREFGFGDGQARLVSVVFGMLSIVVIFLLAQYLFDTSTGLVTATLMTVSQLAVMYSQEARPYAMALCLSACAIYCFCVALRERHWLAWSGFIGFAILMLYTHYYTGLVLAGLFSYGVVRGKYLGIPRFRWLVAVIAVAVALAPWLMSGIVESALRNPKTMPPTQPPWFAVQWSTFLRDLNRFNNGGVNSLVGSSPWWCFIVGGLLFSLPALLALKPLVSRGAGPAGGSPDKYNLALLAILWLAPHVTLLTLAWKGMQYDVRYVLFCVVPYYVLVARGVMVIPAPAWRAAWVIGIVLYSGFALRANYFVPYKENYRDALMHVADAQQPGDCAVFFPFGTLPLQWTVYEAARTPPHIVRPASLESEVDRCARVWLLKYGRVSAETDQLRQLEQKLLTSFTRTEKQEYFWVETTLFSQNRPFFHQ